MQNKFAERLSEKLKGRKISKRAIARIAGVSDVSVCDWTNGKIQPNAESIFLISTALEVSADYLLGLTD